MIPVYTPLFEGNEKKYLQQCIDNQWVSSGYFVEKFEEAFAKRMKTRYAVAVNSGTAALETGLWAAGVRDIDVILPTSTIISCALAIIRVGGYLYFVDIKDDGCIDGDNITPLPGMHTILLPHLFGNKAIVDNTKYMIVDDLSQYWSPHPIQTVGCYSLYSNKLITSGEGGMVVTNLKQIADAAKRYRNLCHTEERFVHDDLGYNFRMSDLQAAVALAQLEQIDKFIEIKINNMKLYNKYLPDKARLVCANADIPWMYLIETDFPTTMLCARLSAWGIDTRRFFYPLHKQKCLNKYMRYLTDCPKSEHAWDYWLYLPSGLDLTEKDIKYVCSCLSSAI